MSLLNVSGLDVYYGSIHAIKDISFEVNEGEIVTLIGANGAGKSTTLRTIAGLVKATKGSIKFKDQELIGMETNNIVAARLLVYLRQPPETEEEAEAK